MLNAGVRPAAQVWQRPGGARRRPQLIAGLALVAACLWGGGPATVPTVIAAATCTGWTSNTVPPETIRVLRSSGPAVGTVQTVPFRQYVKTSIAAEWSPGPVNAMRVGAIAVKQFAWYWTIVWRGKSATDGSCYDVVDTTLDQLYRPETDTPAQALADAVDATWTVSLRKDGRLFDTGYRTGATLPCGADADGAILYQASLYDCARSGMTVDQLLHRYLDPVQIIRPGAGDSTGDGVGDVVVVTPATQTTDVRLYAGGRVIPPAAGVTAGLGVPVALPIASSQTVFRQFADVTGDRLDDMVVLQRTGDGQFQVWVAAATGDSFGPPQLWWDGLASGLTFPPGALVRFAVADMTGDGFADVALLVAGADVPAPGPTPTPTPASSPSIAPSPTPVASAVIGASLNGVPAGSSTARALLGAVPGATLWLFPGTGSGLAQPVSAWNGPLQLAGTSVFAGVVDASGRASLVIQEDMTQQPVPASGLRYVVLRPDAPAGSEPQDWLDLPDLPATSARTVSADVDGDGRMDLVVDRPVGPTGSQLLGLLSTGSAFAPRPLWTNAGKFRWSASRIASADVNGDGRSDIVVLYNAGAAGSRLYRFLSTGRSLRSAGSTTDPALPWAGAAPY